MMMTIVRVYFVRKKDLESENKIAYFHSVIVKEEYRRKGIASKLYELLDNSFKEYKINRVRCVYLCPGGHGWVIPGTENHLHPSVPAIPFNSLVYFFLTSIGFYVQGQIDAFHIDLTKFKYFSGLLNWDNFDAGMAPVTIGVFLLGGIQLLFIGLLGEYILNINTRVIHRPVVVEEKRINFYDKE